MSRNYGTLPDVNTAEKIDSQKNIYYLPVVADIAPRINNWMDHPKEIMKGVFRNMFENHPRWTSLEAEARDAIVRRIERECYNHTIITCENDGVDRIWTSKGFRDRYSMECYRILANLDPTLTGSSYLIDCIIDGTIPINEITGLSNIHLCPEASQKIREGIELRKGVKLEKKISHLYVCYKCGKNETSVIEYQGRAADESASLSIQCINCQYVWRKS